jgi:exodeoxyribonuclease-3
MPLTLATWNINSVRLRLPIVLDFLRDFAPDVLALQEIKCTNDQFPAKALAEAGYPHQAINGQKAYHGVALVSRLPLTGIGRREFCTMGDARHIGARVAYGAAAIDVHNFYIPAGGDEPDPAINPKFRHKLDFFAELRAWFAESQFDSGQVIAGDFNIAPHENDVWSHKQLLKVVSHTPLETDTLNAMRDERQWVDIVRKHIPETERLYSWWSYRAKNWDLANKGRRLDHIWATPDIAGSSTGSQIVRAARGWSEKPSDHVPVIATFG